MHHFIAKTCRSSYAHLFCLSRIRSRMDLRVSKMLCHSLILSRLSFCNLILTATSQYQLSRLQSVMNYAARIVTSSPRSSNSSPLLSQLKWICVADSIRFKIAGVIHKCLFSTHPDYISNEIQRYVPTRALRSSDDTRIIIVTARTRIGNLRISVISAQVWNALPHHIRTDSDFHSFSSLLLTHLRNSHT